MLFKKRGYGMKDLELKLISELMKDSRRSDRQLAKTIGVSQPTVSRMIKRLKKEGYIEEFTIIPNFSKLGFQMLTVVFTKMKRELSQDLIDKVRKGVRENEEKAPSPVLMAMSGMGCDSDRVLVLLSEDFSSYTEYIRMVRQYPLIDVGDVKSFTIDLQDKSQFLPLTLSSLARYLEKKSNARKRN
jgi:DNA-binding Lrp family transcriptional regulator